MHFTKSYSQIRISSFYPKSECYEIYDKVAPAVASMFLDLCSPEKVMDFSRDVDMLNEIYFNSIKHNSQIKKVLIPK